ncbi:MAG: hypothetical protein L7H00_03930, partial [Vulcanisaeta sp.]|nr:hypothetical protein [Vulcanisaeta sp.]
LMRISQGSTEVQFFLNKLGYEMGVSMASTMLRTKYTITTIADPGKVFETAVEMLAVMNLARGVEDIKLNNGKGGYVATLSLIEPFDLDMGLEFTRGYILGLTKILLKCDCNIDAVINKSRVTFYVKGK